MASLFSRSRPRARPAGHEGNSGTGSYVIGRLLAHKSAALAACGLLVGAVFVSSTGWFGGVYDPTSSSSSSPGSESPSRDFLSAPIRFLHSRQEENIKIRPLKVYMYDTLPDWLDADVRTAEYEQEWLTRSSEYNADLWMYNFIANAPFRTLNPAEATLFYVPLLPTRALHLKLWTEGWDKAIKAGSDLVKWGLHWVAHHWPYWYRNNGADHFMTLTSDHGRCDVLSRLSSDVYGDMFIVQHLGDLTMWYGDEDLQEGIGSNAQVEPEDRWPCFRKGRDVLLPAYLPVDEVPHVSPFDTHPRGIGALWRYDPHAPTAQHEYHHVKIRQELSEMFQRDPIHGSDWKSYQTLDETTNDMANSTVCLTPPGVVAHTSRHWRAINSGCIPVTYFRAYDLPFQDYLDYSKFTINIQPDSVNDTAIVVNSLLYDAKRTWTMQEELVKGQKALDWESPNGIARMMTLELQARSDDVQRRYTQ